MHWHRTLTYFNSFQVLGSGTRNPMGLVRTKDRIFDNLGSNQVPAAEIHQLPEYYIAWVEADSTKMTQTFNFKFTAAFRFNIRLASLASSPPPWKPSIAGYSLTPLESTWHTTIDIKHCIRMEDAMKLECAACSCLTDGLGSNVYASSSKKRLQNTLTCCVCHTSREFSKVTQRQFEPDPLSIRLLIMIINLKLPLFIEDSSWLLW